MERAAPKKVEMFSRQRSEPGNSDWRPRVEPIPSVKLPESAVDWVRNARPDLGQFRGLDPARPRVRDSAFDGPRSSDVRSPDFHRHSTLNTLNEQHFRVGRDRWRDGHFDRHGHRFGRFDPRWRHCRIRPFNYYCRGYRPLYPYPYVYYPQYYPYAYSTVYIYEPVPYYVGGTVAYTGSAYSAPAYSAGSTYSETVIDSGVAAQPSYQEAPSAAAPPAIEREPGAPEGVQAPPTGPAGSEELEYRPLTEPGTGTAIGEGNTAFRAGRYDEARQHYSKAILADERDGYAKMLYAVANFAAGDYSVAATAIRRALLTTQELIDYPIDVRTMYADVMTLHAQMQRLAQHVAANPEDKEASLVLAYMHYSIGEAEPARDMFKLMAEDDRSDTLMTQLSEAANRAVESLKRTPPPASPAPTGNPPPPPTPGSPLPGTP